MLSSDMEQVTNVFHVETPDQPGPPVRATGGPRG